MSQKNEYGLTPKQEQFAQAFVNSGYAPNAYKEAYDAEKMSKGVISNEAYKLLKNENVSARIKQLRIEASEQLAIDREMIAKGYYEMMLKAQKNGDDRTYLKASEQLRKMLGLDSASKVELSSNGSFAINLIKPLKSDDSNEKSVDD